MISEKNVKDLLESEDILRNAVKDFYSGKSYVYKTISIELRKLLCDTQNKKDISLFGLMFPEIKIRALPDYNIPASLKEGLVMSMPLLSNYDGKGGMIATLSLNRSCFVSKEEWLNQDLVNKDMTVGKFIRSISDKEGAHSDTTIDEYIKKINMFVIGNEDTYKYLIVAIGEYIANVIDEISKNTKLRISNEHLFKGNYNLENSENKSGT